MQGFNELSRCEFAHTALNLIKNGLFLQSDYEMEVEFNDDAEARRRFESSLPENWVLCSSKTHSGRLYYFNSVTGESRWEHPLIPHMDPPVSFNLVITRHVTIIVGFFITGYRGGRADPGFFLGGGVLVSCSTSTPINHMVFFLQNTSCIRKPQVISGGGGCAPPAPSP